MNNETTGNATVRRRILFHGRVQGVGFRYTTTRICRPTSLVGYVKNLPDGTVELILVGRADIADQAQQQIQQAFSQNVTHVDVEELPEGEDFDRFEIR